jgi:hypothetical protein
VKRVVDRAATRGMPIDTDPAFLTLLEEWIRGDIDTKAMRDRYLDIIALRAAELWDARTSSIGINRSEASNQTNEE